MITIDTNEVTRTKEVANYLETQVTVVYEKLPSADYASLETPLTVGVERKAINNLAGSLVSNELDEQLSRLVDSYDIPVLLVEGLPVPRRDGTFHLYGGKGRDYHYAWFIGALAGWYGRGVWPLMVPSIVATGPTILGLYKLASKEKHREHFEPKKVLPSLSPYNLTQRVMLQFPGVGPERVESFRHETLHTLAGWTEDQYRGELGDKTGKRVYDAWRTK